jgi:hypothetical protein
VAERTYQLDGEIAAVGTLSLRLSPNREAAAAPPAPGRQDLTEALRLTAQGDQAAFRSVLSFWGIPTFRSGSR